jgi:exodeoxyribonuclease-3
MRALPVFKIASWNVNSLSVRLSQVIDWLQSSQVDLLALQETKLVDERFPRACLEDLGYHLSFVGQKTYNGVALISRYSLEDVVIGIPDFHDEQRRVLAATVQGIRVIDVYVPNGSAVGSDKYLYKLAWLSALTTYVEQQLQQYPKLVLLGDFNIAPEDGDVYDPVAWEGSVLVSSDERDALKKLLNLGLVDSFRTQHPDAKQYSWWDYRQASFRRNHGLRIDLILLSQVLSGECVESAIDSEPRRAERPSDHAPVWVKFKNSC